MSYYSLFVIMQDNEFFVRCNLSSNIFNPEIKVDGQWEVAACDLALGNDLPTTSTPIATSVTDQIELLIVKVQDGCMLMGNGYILD